MVWCVRSGVVGALTVGEEVCICPGAADDLVVGDHSGAHGVDDSHKGAELGLGHEVVIEGDAKVGDWARGGSRCGCRCGGGGRLLPPALGISGSKAQSHKGQADENCGQRQANHRNSRLAWQQLR